ncbi:hypothetical protein [Sciscionella sediminilitoris]|uniref:hypothetical protein n=1 Tax=Sciscionella sediminilitoris TaxID=1445613 RepID=UPI0004DFB763|nr:hypothetical protein [Sciscionella sp. SE31]
MNEYVWLHYLLPRTTWYELETAERERCEREFERLRQVSVQHGAQFSGRFHIRGQGDYSQVEIWSFPSAEAAFEHWSRLVSCGYSKWFEFANQLGTAEQNERNK